MPPEEPSWSDLSFCGFTQNNDERLNQLIWEISPKHLSRALSSLKLQLLFHVTMCHFLQCLLGQCLVFFLCQCLQWRFFCFTKLHACNFKHGNQKWIKRSLYSYNYINNIDICKKLHTEHGFYLLSIRLVTTSDVSDGRLTWKWSSNHTLYRIAATSSI